jgi:hypothetical protein
MNRWVAVTLFILAMSFTGSAQSKQVKPAFPPQDPGKPFKPQGEPRLVLKRRILSGDDTIAYCDATVDPTMHQNCTLAPGRTIDELLDAINEQASVPCHDPKMNNASFARKQ